MTEQITHLAERVGTLLQAQGASVATAESCTGGGIAEVLTRIPGSSAWFGYGWVTYSIAAKTSQLKVSEDLIQTDGVVSEAVVKAMAQGAREQADADWAVAVSGIAGPGGGSPAQPVGSVWLAWAGPASTEAECFYFPGDRATVRQAAIEAVLNGLLARLLRP